MVSQIIAWKNEFSNGKELHQFLIKNIKQFEGVKKASAFFVFNRITFSGTTEAGGYSEQAFQKRFTDTSIERLSVLENLMQEINITNWDYQEVVEAEGKNVFIFLDPPYFSATKSALYRKNGKLHKDIDHERFAETMRHSKHKWLITYDDSDYIRDLFAFAYITEWDLMYRMRNQAKNREEATSRQLGNEIIY